MAIRYWKEKQIFSIDTKEYNLSDEGGFLWIFATFILWSKSKRSNGLSFNLCRSRIFRESG